MQSYSFIDFLDAYGAKRPPEMRYQPGEDFGEWRERFKRKMRELLGPVPKRAPLKVEVLETTEADDHVRHLLDITVSEFSSLPAYLLVPKDMKPGEKRPGLLMSHGHATYGMDSLCGLQGVIDEEGKRRSYAALAVSSGYVVLVPAWWGWVGRDGHVKPNQGGDKCNKIQMAAGTYGINVIALHVQDGQAAIDVLAARPEVDSSRIGCAGNSYGGRTTMWLTIFEDRIKACAPSGCMNVFRERSLKLGGCGIQYPFGLLRYGDVPELLSLIAPRPMQLQAGEQDKLITPSDRDFIRDTVTNSYRYFGAEEKFDYQLHPEGHLLIWERAVPFFEKWL